MLISLCGWLEFALLEALRMVLLGTISAGLEMRTRACAYAKFQSRVTAMENYFRAAIDGLFLKYKQILNLQLKECDGLRKYEFIADFSKLL